MRRLVGSVAGRALDPVLTLFAGALFQLFFEFLYSPADLPCAIDTLQFVFPETSETFELLCIKPLDALGLPAYSALI